VSGLTSCPTTPTLTVDLYVSEQLADGSFGPATRIDELNSPSNDQRAMLRHDGLELFFFSDRLGNDDMWVSTRETVKDDWSDPVDLTTLNSAFRDAQPYIASDRETLFFTSNRPTQTADCNAVPPANCGFDLYVTTRHKIEGSGKD
jgi:hypothetical protein